MTGNASTATTAAALTTARTINGTSFDGSANITIPNLVSGSSQIDATATTNFATGVKTQLNSNTVVSGSSQIVGSAITTNTVTVGSTAIALGGTATTIAGLTSVSSTGFTGALTGNASTATTLATARTINGTSFNGSADITIANLVSGSSQVVGSSITTNTITIAGQSTALGSSVTAETIRTAIGTVVTGSAQISLTATTGYGTYLNQAVLTTSSPTFAALTINGAITATGDITAYYTSDKRHKNTIQLIPNALEKVTKLNGVTWEWNDDVNEVTKSTPKTGLIAQEVQEVLPEVVKTRDDGFLALDYSKMMGLMVEAIKEQQTQIHSLTLEIEKLKEPKGL